MALRLTGQRVVLRPPEPRDAAELRQIHATPEVVRWWGRPDPAFPFEEAETTFVAICLDDAPVGWIQFDEELEPDVRHASIDLFVAPAHHRRGIGSDAITTVREELVRRGHHRVTIDPALENTAAIACYERLGFVRVGVMRAYWRDPEGRWRDGLLLDWLAPGVR